MHSAFAMDKDIKFCFLLGQVTKQSPTKKQAQEMFFLCFMFPTQSPLKYLTITQEEPQGYHNPEFKVPLM